MVTEENAGVAKVFNFDPSGMFLNYQYIGRYMNIGGDEAEDAASFTIDEQHFKQAVKEYAQLKDTFGIADRVLHWMNVLTNSHRISCCIQ